MLTLMRCPFHPRVTAVARKRPRAFCQKCRWQVTPKHAYTLVPSRSGLTMPQSRHSVGTYPETGSHATCQGTFGQSSQLAEPLWCDPGLNSGISVHELMSTSKIKKTKKRKERKKAKAQAGGLNGRTFSPNPRKRGKSHRHDCIHPPGKMAGTGD